MGNTTVKYAFPYPVGTDRISDGDNAIQSLAERVETVLSPIDTSVGKLVMYGSSVFCSSPGGSPVAASFPAGRFSVAPMVVASVSTGGNVAIGVNTGGVTVNGCTFYLYAMGSGTWTSGGVSVYFLAFASIL